MTLKKAPTGELEIFRTILVRRGAFSQVNNEQITPVRPKNFAHLLPKAQNKYPMFKLFIDNIWLMTDDQHYKWDEDRESIREDHMWQKVFKEEARLMKLYNDMYGRN